MISAPRTIAITGGIACGKSTVARTAARLANGNFFGADEAVRRLLDSPRIQNALRNRFPSAFPQGVFSKALLRNLVFKDADARSCLESILHPEVYQLCEEAREKALENDRRLFAEIPLLYETGAEDRFDAVWVVASSPEIFHKRLLARPGITSTLACEMVNAQWPLAEKIRKADVVLWNDGSLAALELQIITALGDHCLSDCSASLRSKRAATFA
jgi:dephospho-CoA kinase